MIFFSRSKPSAIRSGLGRLLCDNFKHLILIQMAKKYTLWNSAVHGGTKGADPGTHFQSLFRAQKLTQPSGTHQKWGWPLSSTIFCTERQGHQNLGTTHCTWLHLNFSALVISQFAHFCEEKKIGSKTYLLIFHWFKSTHSKIWINDDIFPVTW